MEVVIAVVLAAMINRAWEESRSRARTAWADARTTWVEAKERRAAAAERLAEAEERLVEAEERLAAAKARRAEARKQRRGRMRRARLNGPRDPLWWLWAAGWVTAATARTAGAAARGARIGAREGYRIGRERARERAQERARRRREHEASRAGRRAGQAQAATHNRPRTGARPGPTARPTAGPAPGGAGEVPVEPCPSCGAYVTDPAACPCRVTAGPEDTTPDTSHAEEDDSEVIDAEIVDDDAPTTGRGAGPYEIERTPMLELTSGMSGGDGEGYASTISALEQIQNLLGQISQVITDLGETLTAHNLDAETTSGVTEADDLVQAAADVVGRTLAHAQAKHEPVAAAVAAAGGSDQIADPRWYDDV